MAGRRKTGSFPDQGTGGSDSLGSDQAWKFQEGLLPKFLGLYEILALPGTHSVTLRLPDSLHAVHPIFHISMLEPATLNPIPDWIQPPPPPIIVDDELEF